MHTPQLNLDNWKTKAAKALKPPMEVEDLDWLLPEGIRIKPVYDASSLGVEHAYLTSFHQNWKAKAEGRNVRFMVSGHGLSALTKDEIRQAEGYGFSAWDLSECPENAQVETGLPKVLRAWGKTDAGKVEDPLMDALRLGQIGQTTLSPSAQVVLHGSDAAKAGANPVQELAAVLCAAEVCKAQLGTEAFKSAAENWTLQLSAGTSFWLELAKFRAMRLLWMHFLNENGIIGQIGNIRAETGTLTWSHTDPDTNLLRHTSSVLSALMGGADEVLIHPHRMDEPLDGVRLAVNIGLLALEEAHLDRAFDPAHGSYFVEMLTHELATAAWKKYKTWNAEPKGDLSSFLRTGLMQSEIQRQGEQTLEHFASKKRVQLGVNTFPSELSRPGKRFALVPPSSSSSDFPALKPVFADA